MSDARPASSSSGQLARTPLPHLLVYAAERRLTGTFEFRGADGGEAAVLLREGQPAKARLASPPIYLGQVMVELGFIDGAKLDASLRELSGQRKLHGALLLERNHVTSEQLETALRAQILRKVAQIAHMPPASVFEFYSDWDGLSTFGGEPTPVDAMAAVWAAIREHPPLEHVKAALERLSQGRLRVAKTAQLDRFGFTQEERHWIDLLRVRPLGVDDFFAAAEINERIARLIAYCLAITKQVDLVADAEPSSSGKIPAAEPSAPQSPRAAVARMALRRERMRTGPVVVEEKSSPRMPVVDRRASPPPDAPSAFDARRAEIQARAQQVDKQNYFEMLGVTEDATVEDIKVAYINLAKSWHPDRLHPALSDVKDACQRVFARMSEAHQTLTDEEKRRRYQRLMKEGGETPEQQQEIANVVGATVEFQKAEICMRKNDLTQALSLAKHALELDPQQADYIALAAWLTSLGPGSQTPEATQACVDELTRALQRNERCEKAYFYRAMLYRKQSRDQLAFKDFKKVSELNPKNIDAQRELRLYEMRSSIAPPRQSQPPSKPGLFQKLFKK
jgi:tetratricopeptide (TPR) repeat protein